jgi:hypothetical protein
MQKNIQKSPQIVKKNLGLLLVQKTPTFLTLVTRPSGKKSQNYAKKHTKITSNSQKNLGLLFVQKTPPKLP